MDIIVAPTKTNLMFDSQVFSTLMSCGRLTDFRFNLNLTGLHGKSVSLEMGSIVHTFLEYYYKSLISGLKKDQAQGIAYTAALEYSQSKDVTNATLDDREWALNTCEQYLTYYKNDFWTPLEVEVVKTKKLYEDDNIRIGWKAKFDLVSDTNQGIFPVDHKTMKQRRDTLTLNNQFIGQCLLMDTRMMFVNKVGFQKSLKPEEKFTRVNINYSADRLMEWQSEILPYWAYKYIEYSESGYWPPNFTHCENKYGNCMFQEACSVDRNLRHEVLASQFIVGEIWDPSNE